MVFDTAAAALRINGRIDSRGEIFGHYPIRFASLVTHEIGISEKKERTAIIISLFKIPKEPTFMDSHYNRLPPNPTYHTVDENHSKMSHWTTLPFWRENSSRLGLG